MVTMVTFEQMTTEKFRFVALGILHTITPSRTRLPHLAHDFRVGRDGCFAVSGRKPTG